MQENSAYISPLGHEPVDQVTTLLHLVRVLLSELRRRAPNNDVTAHANATLEVMELALIEASKHVDTPEMAAALDAARDARQVLRSADNTVEVLRAQEDHST